METEVKCAVLACKTMIGSGDTYYLLGGGKVVTCENCACNTPYTLIVNKKEVHLTRGWDKTACVDRLRKVMQ